MCFPAPQALSKQNHLSDKAFYLFTVDLDKIKEPRYSQSSLFDHVPALSEQQEHLISAAARQWVQTLSRGEQPGCSALEWSVTGPVTQGYPDSGDAELF